MGIGLIIGVYSAPQGIALTRGWRAIVASSAILLTLAACSKPQDQAESPKLHGPVALSFKVENDNVQVDLTLPKAIETLPELHEKLYAEGQSDLQSFANAAGKDHAELAQQGFLQPPYSRTILWSIAAESPRLASLYAHIATDEGGAHPNTAYQTLVWDRETKRALTAADLFAKGADLKSVNNFLCHALEAERSKRVGKPISQGGNCPRIEDAQMVLLASTTPGKIGGVALLYAPYSFGAYAEGGYEIRIGQGLFRQALNPTFAADFAGEPASAPLFPAAADASDDE